MNDIQVGPSRPVSPHNQALYEAGKQLLTDSITVGREFCKFMVGISTGAIPLYLALLTLALPKDYRPAWWKGIAAIVPASLFLLAAVTFALGVFPRTGTFSLDYPEQIDTARSNAISWRRNVAIVGFSLFALAATMSIVVTIAALRVKAPQVTPKPTVVRIIK
jgi:hypothetical protein